MEDTFATTAYSPYPLKGGESCLWGTPPDPHRPFGIAQGRFRGFAALHTPLFNTLLVRWPGPYDH